LIKENISLSNILPPFNLLTFFLQKKISEQIFILNFIKYFFYKIITQNSFKNKQKQLSKYSTYATDPKPATDPKQIGFLDAKQ